MKLKRKVLQTACEATGVDYERLVKAYETIIAYGMDQWGNGYGQGFADANPGLAYQDGYNAGKEAEAFNREFADAAAAYNAKQQVNQDTLRDEEQRAPLFFDCPPVVPTAEQVAASFFQVSNITGDDEHAYVTKAVEALDVPEQKKDWRENDEDYNDFSGYWPDCNCDSCQDRREELGGPRVIKDGIEF